jgi:hypothetical protein
VLGNGDNVGACYFGDGDTAVGLVGCVQVDVVGADSSGDSNLELLGLCETLSGEVAGVETACRYVLAVEEKLESGKERGNERSSDDDLSIDELPVEGRVLALLVRGSNESVSLTLKPFADTELVLRCA